MKKGDKFKVVSIDDTDIDIVKIGITGTIHSKDDYPNIFNVVFDGIEMPQESCNTDIPETYQMYEWQLEIL